MDIRTRKSQVKPSLNGQSADGDHAALELATLTADDISAWFGDHQVLDRVSSPWRRDVSPH